ncbi:MAG: VOC family protein [Chloroflexi bacterium]|nr:VOC family protein [Chloroflexota bacterium]
MLPAVDHLVYAAPSLDAGIEAMAERLGVTAAYGGKHTGIGTHNALLSLGRSVYLEIIAPDPDQPPPSEPLPFGLADLHEPGLVAWALAVTGIESRAESARDAGYDPGPVIAMTRALPEGGELSWRLCLRRPVAGDGLVPFLIQWEPGSHPSASSPGGCTLTDLTAEHPRPDEVSRMMSAIGVDLQLVEAARPALIATIEGPHGTVVLT